jgi:integrase
LHFTPTGASWINLVERWFGELTARKLRRGARIAPSESSTPTSRTGPSAGTRTPSAAMTGLRQGELIALRWRDVDWAAGRIRVRQNYVRGQFGTPKSRRSARSVPLADRVAGELERHHQVSYWIRDDDLVFASPSTGGPLERSHVLRVFKNALAAARLDERHVFHEYADVLVMPTLARKSSQVGLIAA